MIVTDHAFDMSKSRLGWNRAATRRMAEKALRGGIAHSQTRGRLNRYISKLYLSHGKANNTRIYGEHIFLFAGDCLITVLHLPHELKSAANKCGTTGAKA